MSPFEIKTHQAGRTYSEPHFFMLCRAERKETVRWTVLVIEPAGVMANSGRPMPEPCPNCFVITTQSEENRESLFYLCLSLKIGRYFTYYLKGSVIPFICISDAKKVMNAALQNNQEHQWKIKVEKLKKINVFEENLKQQLLAISQLKTAMLRF